MKIYSFARWSLFAITLFWVAVILSSPSFSAREQSPAMSKIAPWVLENTADGKQAEFLVVLADQADLSTAKTLATKAEKGRFVRETLWNKAQATQGPLLDWLRERKIEHRAYYIVNMVWVKGNADVALALASRSEVARLDGNPQIRNFPDELVINEDFQTEVPATVEWGVTNTRAPLVWAAGFTGQGIVVAGADTGYRWDHNALKGKYRGWNGATASHDYNWHDSIHTGGGTCGPNAIAPCDDQGHGTHTMGTIAGDDGAGNQVGMAPGAKWIGCRNMNQGVGTPATYIECFEFFLAPYPVGGTPAQGDSSLAPDVSNNSWGCPPSEGCSANTLQAAVEAQRAAGIMTVVSAGNGGSGCSTVNDPPAIYDASYSIGAHDISNNLASFSSRGPVLLDGSGRLKPDITAPGVSVRSSTRTSTTSYGSLSGTSMAGPHVAGAVAVLWSARPALRNDIAATEAALNSSAVPVMSTSCTSPASVPNNLWGYGRLDIKAAVDQLAVVSVVSRKLHGSQAYDIPLPLTGEPGVECRSSGGNHTLVVTFNNPVVSGNAAVTSGAGTAGSPSFGGSSMTVDLSGVTDVQKVVVTLSGVTAATGGPAMPNTTVSMNILAGDTDGSKLVSGSDVGFTKSNSGSPVNATNFKADVAVSGEINTSDVGLVKSRSGSSVP